MNYKKYLLLFLLPGFLFASQGEKKVHFGDIEFFEDKTITTTTSSSSSTIRRNVACNLNDLFAMSCDSDSCDSGSEDEMYDIKNYTKITRDLNQYNIKEQRRLAIKDARFFSQQYMLQKSKRKRDSEDFECIHYYKDPMSKEILARQLKHLKTMR